MQTRRSNGLAHRPAKLRNNYLLSFINYIYRSGGKSNNRNYEYCNENRNNRTQSFHCCCPPFLFISNRGRIEVCFGSIIYFSFTLGSTSAKVSRYSLFLVISGDFLYSSRVARNLSDSPFERFILSRA